MEYYPCDICKEIGECNCRYCELGNPCIGCTDYDEKNDICKSNGGCGKADNSQEEGESE